MTIQEYTNKYAYLLVKLGVALQPGEYMILEADVENYELVRSITQQAFLVGAKDVLVYLRDAYVTKTRAVSAQVDDIATVLPWQKESLSYYLERGAVSLKLESPHPQLLDDVSDAAAHALNTFTNDLRNVIRNAWGQLGTRWCLACAPNRDWAETLFPEFSPEVAYEKLWSMLMSFCRVDDASDPVQNWINFSDAYRGHSEWLNRSAFDTIHFQNSLGTDLRIGLRTPCRWIGGQSKAARTPTSNMGNIPSNEVATSPDKYRVDGLVHASRPLLYMGKKIDSFWLEFQGGKVVRYGAQTGEASLAALLDTDEGSRRIGEVAFVESNLPLARSGLIFYNTLLDENAACHLALGKGYAICIPGLSATDTDAWEDAHLNFSRQHVDFMFGTDDMKADGLMTDSKRVPIFRDGKFVREASTL
ncbi:aminopeptidase [Clostridia bacterium]|nr:aminopeptidase [Clostridia bacterium]